MSTRIGDAALSYQLTQNVRSIRSRMNDAQVSVSTGKSARAYSDVAGDSSLLINSKDQRSTASNFIKQNEQVVDRLKTMEGTLSSVANLAERFRNILLQRMDAASGKTVPLDSNADSMTKQLASLLNTELGDRYLFAGSKTDQEPVSLPATRITTVDATQYYQGDAIKMTTRAETDIEIEYGVTADEPVFARLFGTMGRAAEAHVNNDRAEMEASLQQMKLAIEEVADMRGQIGTDQGRIEAVAEGQRAAVNYLDNTISRIEDTNLPQAITAIANDRVNLEATFATISRISQLSLADYLR